MHSQQILLLITSAAGTFAAPSPLFNLPALLNQGSASPSATSYTCEGAVPQITSCNSKTSTVSCHNVADNICNQIGSDRAQKALTGSHTEGTCTGRAYTNGNSPTYEDCMAAFGGINDNCLKPNEAPDPSNNAPIMRGWQNIDPGNTQINGPKGCGYAFNTSLPSYELASNNCIGKWGTGCAGADYGGQAPGNGYTGPFGNGGN